MAKYRALQVNFWDDGFVLDLTPEEKYFYVYLLTNSRTSQCGCYELPYKIMEMQTGYNRETVEKLIKRFVDYGKIKYCLETKEIFLVNWSKHNFTGSPKVMNCIVKEIEAIKNTEFKAELYKVCIAYGYPIDTLSIDYGEKQKEKQKEKEKQPPKRKSENETKNTVEVVDKIKSYFLLDDNDIKKVADVFAATNKSIDYLEEKLKLTKNNPNTRDVVGYLISALKNDYKSSINDYRCFIPKVRTRFHNFNERPNSYSPDELERNLLESQKGKFN